MISPLVPGFGKDGRKDASNALSKSQTERLRGATSHNGQGYAMMSPSGWGRPLEAYDAQIRDGLFVFPICR
jgi:hypothetical protein